jgi:hypothetical protein
MLISELSQILKQKEPAKWSLFPDDEKILRKYFKSLNNIAVDRHLTNKEIFDLFAILLKSKSINIEGYKKEEEKTESSAPATNNLYEKIFDKLELETPELLKVMTYLKKARFFDFENFKLIKGQRYHTNYNWIRYLSVNNLLTQRNIKLGVRMTYQASETVWVLKLVGILTQRNFECLIDLSILGYHIIFKIMEEMGKLNILNQPNFDLLFTNAHYIFHIANNPAYHDLIYTGVKLLLTKPIESVKMNDIYLYSENNELILIVRPPKQDSPNSSETKPEYEREDSPPSQNKFDSFGNDKYVITTEVGNKFPSMKKNIESYPPRLEADEIDIIRKILHMKNLRLRFKFTEEIFSTLFVDFPQAIMAAVIEWHRRRGFGIQIEGYSPLIEGKRSEVLHIVIENFFPKVRSLEIFNKLPEAKLEKYIKEVVFSTIDRPHLTMKEISPQPDDRHLLGLTFSKR